MSFLLYIAAGLLLGVVYEAGRNMNYDIGPVCILSNGIVLAFYGTIGYFILKYAYLAYLNDLMGWVIFLIGLAAPFVTLAVIAVINIFINGWR